MLTLTFLGVGSAFAKRNHNSNVLIELWKNSPAVDNQPDETMLIDFGCAGPMALHELKERAGFRYLSRDGKINYRNIQRILVTHQHADHIGGLEELALTNVFVLGDLDAGDVFKPQIISSMNILVNLWDTSLKGGLSPLPGRYAMLQDYFNIHALRPTPTGYRPYILADRYEFDIFATDHVRIERKYDWPSYGVEIRDLRGGESVFYSGDTRFDFEAYEERMERSKIIFHDAQLHEITSPVHALLSELRTMPRDIKKRAVLYHYGDDWDHPQFAFVADEFAGFAKPHHRYVLFE
ncbi:MAG: MBL fold metallo-hydrolase [Phycisphaerales bacterium]|nr:MBL fold metallo-hydrolase [Phycisphaerales bacterium]